jgi:regulatory protein
MQESSRKSDLRQSLAKYAGRILSARPYFRFKLREKLFLRAEKLNFDDPDSTIDSILDDLAKSGYLDDQYLAEAYVRSRLSKGYGPKIISLKLKFMGLCPETISMVLESTATEEAEIASIKRFCRKYPHTDSRKLVSKLYFRGYSGTSIKKAFDGDYFED